MSEELEIEYIEMGESEEDKPASSAEPGAVDEAPENLTPDKYLVWRMNRWRGEFAVFYRAVLGEFFATAMFVFMILSAVIHFSRSQDLHNTTHIINPVVGGVSTAFAACVVAYSFADISGAHFNPAVTFATVVTFKMSIVKGFCYMVSQCAGATFACLTIALIFPAHITDLKKVVVKPVEDVYLYQAFFSEVILTFIFVYVVFAVAFDTIERKKLSADQKVVGRKLTVYNVSGKSKAGFAPLAIGFALGALVLASGTISGGAFNPARAWGPALVTGIWTNHWLYWIGDFTGAFLAAWLQKIFSKPWQRIPEFKNPKQVCKWVWQEQWQFQTDYKKFIISWLV